ncbi:MAG: hypothetical protein ACYDD4_03355 [Acidimicrobiales bacterium]
MTAVIDDAVAGLRSARPATGHGRDAVEDLEVAASLVRLACRDGRARAEGDGQLASIPAAERSSLSRHLGEVIDAHRHRWVRTNRRGGLDESCSWLEHLRSCYDTGEVQADWAGPLVELVRAKERS